MEEIFNAIDASGFDLLPITLPHILELSRLESHHNDPFDRIIIAQAITENLQLLSVDNHFPSYNGQLVQE
ncbi:type II toxin-antitoxin system VapC family toxin [Pedobacter endophyticus]|uniref:type II toxin-antitoxin system VapC family toxin n=1 Tax=Pedobacter endophyticus TaxID=2789740 RepID=UPI003742CFA7